MLAPVRPAPAREPSRATLWQARIVCLSAFGPYLAGGIRTEQAVVFALAVWALATGWQRLMHAPGGLLPVMAAWCALIGVALIGTSWRPAEIGGFGTQPVSHGLAELLWPLALMVLAWWWSGTVSPRRLVLLAARITVAGMCADAVISIAQALAGNPAVIGVLPHFWDAPGSAGSVALLAAGNSRYTGIFNQPAEAGTAYALALCCLIYLAQIRAVRGQVTAAGIALLVTGGVLTGSKVFLLGGLPVAVLMLAADRSRLRVAAAAVCAAAALWLAALAGLAPAQAGGGSLGNILHPSLAEWTAGRYGSSATLAPAVADVLRSSPWYGFGAGSLAVAYDSMWLEVLAIAGLAGVILVAVVFVILAVKCAGLRYVLPAPDRRLAWAALAVAAGASFGLPSLSANRASVLLWMILGPLLCCQARQATR